MDKRQQLVITAFELFYRQGIHAVGINQILQVSGIAKKTLYHHFAGKEALVVATLAYRDAVYLQWLDARLAQGKSTVTAVIDTLFAALDDWINDREQQLTPFQGCFFINTCGEYGDLGHDIHQQCASHKTAIMTMLADYLQRTGLAPQAAERLATTLCLLKEGVTVQAHVQGNKQAAINARQLALMAADCSEI
ncbi:TetR family transcriptional regulator [Oceanisphaera marina]|uniref:TetR family transcriptional regulator n=1 Tax=Oceanisphaera marina TaxID=2017550 RepID=A0ABQ1IR41_9GAMM|nr:TetR/AcrR family transcriptional regulator [Oceanisphaera marina]GGB50440.1 TetR family transcriptional regulator [Oceanisphaera marina]